MLYQCNLNCPHPSLQVLPNSYSVTVLFCFFLEYCDLSLIVQSCINTVPFQKHALPHHHSVNPWHFLELFFKMHCQHPLSLFTCVLYYPCMVSHWVTPTPNWIEKIWVLFAMHEKEDSLLTSATISSPCCCCHSKKNLLSWERHT